MHHRFGALIVDLAANIFDISHIESGISFDDDALQYMVERSNHPIDTDSDVLWVFTDSYDEMIAYLKNRKIKIAPKGDLVD